MSILDDIAKYKREEVAAAKARLSDKALDEKAWAQSPPRGISYRADARAIRGPLWPDR